MVKGMCVPRLPGFLRCAQDSGEVEMPLVVSSLLLP